MEYLATIDIFCAIVYIFGQSSQCKVVKKSRKSRASEIDEKTAKKITDQNSLNLLLQ